MPIIDGTGGDNTLNGTTDHDLINGGGGSDTITGDAGDDLIRPGSGDDSVDGGTGWNRVSYYAALGDTITSGVTVSLLLQGGAQNTTSAGSDTLTNIQHLTGTIYDDVLTGDGGDNWLWGGFDPDANGGLGGPGGNETISAGGGNDLVEVGSGNHTLDGGTGEDALSFFSGEAGTAGRITFSLALQGAAQATGEGLVNASGFESLSGSVHDDRLSGNGSNNIIAGDLGSDFLFGGDGDDGLFGDGRIAVDTHDTGYSGPIAVYEDAAVTFGLVGGDDVLEGGLGNDYLVGGDGSDTAVYTWASGSVTVVLTDDDFSFASGADGNDTLVGIENVAGALGYNNLIFGNSAANSLEGGYGHDQLNGLQGNDILFGGYSGDDLMRPGTGDDYVGGGNGWDRVSYASVGSDTISGGVTVSLLLQGTWQDTGAAGHDYLAGIAHLTGSIHNDVLTGDGGDNWIWGGFDPDANGGLGGPGGSETISAGGGNDLVEVGSGNHTLDGGTGNDTLSFFSNGSGTSGAVTYSLALQGAAYGTNQGSLTASGFENLSGSVHDDILVGDGGNNVIAGDLGNDNIAGGAGNDTLYGDGRITVDTHGTGYSGPITTFADIAATFSLTSGLNYLEGGLGDDAIHGGGGFDYARYENAAGAVTVSLTATGGSATGADGNDTLFNIEAVLGSNYNDVILGNDLTNQLVGHLGHDFIRGGGGNDELFGHHDDDYLDGGPGDDILDGGDGWDRASYATGATGGVSVNLTISGSQATGAGMDTLEGIEHVTGTIFNDVLTGDDGDNWLWGGSDGSGLTGNDTINAGGGGDLVEVGTGTHTLGGGTGTDTLSLRGNTVDITPAGVTFSLALQDAAQDSEQGMITASGFENLSGSIYDDNLTGDANANILLGERGNDTLTGGNGDDTLYGDGYMSIATIPTGGGPITLYSDITALIEVPGGNDILVGGRGDDFLHGGRGDDAMTGSQGSDTFVIEFNSGDDRVTDFSNMDTIRFDASSGIDAFGDLTITQVGRNTLITWGTTDSLLLEGVRGRSIGASDFEFGAAALASDPAPANEQWLGDSAGEKPGFEARLVVHDLFFE